MKKVLLAAAISISFVVTAHATQLLSNPGFETGDFTSWTAGGGAPVVTNAQAHSGTYSVAAFGNEYVQQDFAPIATSSITEVSFWVKRSGGPFDGVFFYYSDNTFNDFTVGNASGSSDWTFFDITSLLAAGKFLTGVRVFGTTSGPAYLDDFTVAGNINVSATPIPGALPLFVSGLGALAFVAYRRKRGQAV